MSVAMLTPGFDPTTLAPVATPCGTAQEISAGDLLAMIANAAPANNIAWIWRSSTQPDIIGTPKLAEFLWFNPDNEELRAYNGTSWELFSYVAQSIDGGAIIDGTLPVAAIMIPMGSAYKIIQVNSTGDGWQFITINDAIQNGSISIFKLTAGPAGTFAYSDGSTTQWRPITAAMILTLFPAGSFPLDRLVAGTNGYVLTMVGGVPTWSINATSGLAVTAPDTGKYLTNDGVNVMWGALPNPPVAVSNLVPGTNTYVLQTVGGVVVWSSLPSVLGTSTSGLLTIPSTWNNWYPAAEPYTYDLRWAHGLAARPTKISVMLVCRVSYGLYTAAKSTIPLFELQGIGSFSNCQWATWADDVYVYVKKMVNADTTAFVHGAGTIEDGGNSMTSRWDWQITASL